MHAFEQCAASATAHHHWQPFCERRAFSFDLDRFHLEHLFEKKDQGIERLILRDRARVHCQMSQSRAAAADCDEGAALERSGRVKGPEEATESIVLSLRKASRNSRSSAPGLGLCEGVLSHMHMCESAAKICVLQRKSCGGTHSREKSRRTWKNYGL